MLFLDRSQLFCFHCGSPGKFESWSSWIYDSSRYTYVYIYLSGIYVHTKSGIHYQVYWGQSKIRGLETEKEERRTKSEELHGEIRAFSDLASQLLHGATNASESR